MAETRQSLIIAVVMSAVLWGSAPMAQDAHQHGDLHRHATELFPRTAEFDYEVPAPGTYELPVIKAAPDGRVLTEDGEATHLHALMNGRVTVLSFIYTRCSDARGCPLSTGLLSDIQYATSDHAELSDKVRLISLSFDPVNDRPETMTEYGGVAGDQGVPWQFLTTAGEEELAPILAGYGQTIDRRGDPTLDASGAQADDGTGVIYHLLRVYLVDQDGRIRNIYGLGYLDPRLLIADILTLLREQEE